VILSLALSKTEEDPNAAPPGENRLGSLDDGARSGTGEIRIFDANGAVEG
jgi:hypothetical protein